LDIGYMFIILSLYWQYPYQYSNLPNLPPEALQKSQSLQVRISDISEDAEESPSGGIVDLGSSDLELIQDEYQDRGAQTVGLRFNNVGIPQGARILNAYIQFQSNETSSETTSLLIQGEAEDNAKAFSSTPNNISSRKRINVAVGWWPTEWTTIDEAGPDQRTSDISLIISEIVGRSGWSSGNSLAIIITGSGKRVAESYDGDPSGAPLLHVEYVVPNVWHVDGQSVTDPATCDEGDSWTYAFKTIQKAIDCASTGDEIWIKGGTYALTSTINVNKKVAMYGGFSGGETHRWQRDWETNETIIDGQESINCIITKTDIIVDGLTIINGISDSDKATAPGVYYQGSIAGLLNISNCKYSNNYGEGKGGAIDADPSATLILTNCTFSMNRSIANAAAISIHGSTTINGCKFQDNANVEDGTGAINISGPSIIINCTFENNGADFTGAISFSGGPSTIANSVFYKNWGMFGSSAIRFSSSTATIRDSIFYKNSGGDAISAINGELSNIDIFNCTFLENISDDPRSAIGDTIINNSGFISVTNSIIWGDSSSGRQIYTNDTGTTIVTDSNYPNDFTIHILSYPNYTVDNNTITPNHDFIGVLNVPVYVNDGSDKSYNYILKVTVNIYDGCPGDPNKTEAGICGCGVSDTDTDRDGTLDCNDNCFIDPQKINPGVCGCGINDVDDNDDGTPDCIDAQPVANIISPATDQTITVGESIKFKGSVSSGNTPYSYSWDFDGGATSLVLRDPGDVVFNKPGTFHIVFTVADNDGDIDSDKVTITVNEQSGGGGGGCFIGSAL
jgi:hypothetical protein